MFFLGNKSVLRSFFSHKQTKMIEKNINSSRLYGSKNWILEWTISTPPIIMSFWVRKHGKIEKKILNHFWAIAGHFTGENGIFVGFYHEKIVSFKSIAVKIILLTGIRRGHTDNHSHVVWSLYLLWFIFYRTSKFKKWGKTHIFLYIMYCHSVTMG